MFDNLADPLGPLSDDAFDAVLDRARRKQHVQIRIVAVCVAAACIAVIVGVTAAADGTGRKVVVTHQGTSTTTPRATTSTAPAETTTTTTPIVVPPPPPTQPATTTTTLPPSMDTSHIVATFQPSKLTLRSGEKAQVRATFVNTGPYPVTWNGDDSACGPYEVTGGPQGEQILIGPVPLWPAPQAVVSCAQAPSNEVLAPGATKTEIVTVLAGAMNDAGHVVPALPGDDCFSPVIFGNGVDTKWCAPQSVPVTITPPASPPFTANRPTSAALVAGKEARVPFTLTNELPFSVDFQFTGPKTIPASGRDDCSPASGTAWVCNMHLKAHESLALILDVWGTTDYGPPSKTNKALIPGQFDVPWNEKTLHLTVTAK